MEWLALVELALRWRALTSESSARILIYMDVLQDVLQDVYSAVSPSIKVFVFTGV